MTRIKLYATTWSTDTAGVSPHNNMRTELFFKGCDRAMEGNPCKGCFNSPLWYMNEEDTSYTPEEIAQQIQAHAPYPYVTIGGGEPTAQMEGLIELTALLKTAGFHIMVYTWKDLGEMLKDNKKAPSFVQLLNHIDILVDGEFKLEERLYRPKAKDGFFSSIGSANQTIWDAQTFQRSGSTEIKGYRMGDVTGLKLDEDNGLGYMLEQAAHPKCIRMPVKFTSIL